MHHNHNFLEADNVGMRNDVEISYQLLVFPYRELVSDFVRARKVPYCNVSLACAHHPLKCAREQQLDSQESILRLVQILARRLHRRRASAVCNLNEEHLHCCQAAAGCLPLKEFCSGCSGFRICCLKVNVVEVGANLGDCSLWLAAASMQMAKYGQDIKWI